jgi:hypothetical protein
VKLIWLLPIAALLGAQDHPQFVWQGQVDGTAILHIVGKHLTVQLQHGGPVERQKYHFFDPLPETQQNVRLDVRQGRGYVHVLDQPNIDNHYTLAIAIEDPQPGSSLYSLAVYWDTSNNRFESDERTDRVAWGGRVDGSAIVSCQERSCVSSAGQGAPVTGERFKFTRPLPDRDVDVHLEDADGRGEIRLIEQPRRRNNFTARVSIRDPLPGASDYSFALVWNRAAAKPPKESKNPNESAQPFEPLARGFLWSGRVQGRVRVTLEGGASFSQVVAGAPVEGESAAFVRPLPERANLMPQIKKLEGRGQVSIVQSPSENNHYRLIFEIADPGPGAGDYEIEVDW